MNEARQRRNGQHITQSKSAAKRTPVLLTAPLVPGKKIPKTIATHIPKKSPPSVRRIIPIIKKRSSSAAIIVKNGYQAVDRQVVRTVKATLPRKTRQKIHRNRATNNGNIVLNLPIKKAFSKPLKITLPQKLKHARHAILPTAIALLLIFTIMPARASQLLYSSTHTYGSAGDDTANDITADSLGNTYTVGYFSGTVAFDASFEQMPNGGAAKSSGLANTSGYITKTNSNGSYGWTKQFTGDYNSGVNITSVTADTNNNIYLLGNFMGNIDFSDDWSEEPENIKSNSGIEDLFVTKINNDGSYGWTKQFGGASTIMQATDIVTDSSDNIFIAGNFNDSVTFDADFGSFNDSKQSSSGYSASITRINSNGSYGWTHKISSTSQVSANTLCTIGSNLYIGGNFAGDAEFDEDFGSSTDNKSTPSGISNGFITRVSTAGAYDKSWHISSTDTLNVTSLTSDSINLIVGGTFTAGTTFDTDWNSSLFSLTAAGSQDSYIMQINSSSDAVETVNSIGGSGADVSLNSISVTNNVIYVGGNLIGSAQLGAAFGDSQLFSAPYAGSAGFVLAFEQPGDFDWAQLIQSSSNTALNASVEVSAVLPFGTSLLLAGSFIGDVDFGQNFGTNDNISSDTASRDAYVTKLSSEPIHKIVADESLAYTLADGTNLSSTGSSESSPLVYVHDKSDATLLATISADLTADRDWSGAHGDSNMLDHIMYVSGLTSQPGAANSYTLYIPKRTSDLAVYICTGASSLATATPLCTNRQTYTVNSPGVSVATVGSVDYWVLTNQSEESIGGGSIASPGVRITEPSAPTSVYEGGAGDSIEVRLHAQPTDDVTVSLSLSPTGQITTIDPIVFTSANWDQPVTVNLSAIDDHAIEGTHIVSLGYTTTSTDPAYTNITETAVLSITISDNDTAGVTLSSPSLLTSESGTTTSICYQLTAQPTANVSLTLESSNTAEVTIESPLVITPVNWNSAENCVTATGVDDALVDGNMTAIIRISGTSSSDGNFSGLLSAGLPTATITNQDDESISITFTTKPSAITSEDGTNAEVCAVLSARPASGSVTIPLASSDQTEGTLGDDHITISAANWNASTNCVAVNGVDDDLTDGDVTYTITTGKPTSTDSLWNVLEADDVADISFINLDDDVASLLFASNTNLQVTEGGANDTFTIRLQSQPAIEKVVVVDISTVNAQLTTSPQSLTFTNTTWATPQTVTLSAVDDALLEGDHNQTVSITIDPATTEASYLPIEANEFSVAIADNETADVNITAINDASENPAVNGTMQLTLDKVNHTAAPITINYSVAGSAQSNVQYAALSGTALIPIGQDTVDITIDVSGKNNSTLQGTRTVSITLTGTNSGIVSIGATDNAVLSIFDDDTAQASLSVSQNGNEAGPVNIIYTATLSRSNNTGAPITISLAESGGTATSDSDYTGFNGATISIADGAISGIYEVAVLDDDELEATETLMAAISSPSNSAVSIESENASATATITDNDTTTASINTGQDAAEPNINGTFVVSLAHVNHTGGALTVGYDVSGTATSDSDYSALSGTVEIPDGQISAPVTVTVIDDMFQENPETIALTYNDSTSSSRISASSDGELNTASIILADNEVAGIHVAITDDTVTESGGTAKICFTLTSIPSDSVTIPLTNPDETKVSLPDTITITPANWNKTDNCVTATGLHDNLVTGPLTITVTPGDVLSNDPFYTLITGDSIDAIALQRNEIDTAGITVSTVSNRTKEDGSKTAIIRFVLATRPFADVTIPLTISDDTEGSLQGIDHITITAGNWNTAAANEVTVYGVDDDLTDGDVAYTVTTGSSSSTDTFYQITGSTIADGNLINEDDDGPGVAILESGATSLISEDGQSDTHTVVLQSQPAAGKKVVVTATPNNNQLSVGNGNGATHTLTFTNSNWNIPQTVTITANDDDLLEDNHSAQIIYTLSSETDDPTYADLPEALSSITVDIIDNDTATVSLTASGGNEAGPSDMTFTAALSKVNNTSAPITFNLQPTGGSAIAGTDYANFSGAHISIAIGESTGITSVQVIDDALLEGDETVQATISSPSANRITINTASAATTITDNDTATVTIIATQPSAAENPSVNGEATVYLSKTNNTPSPIVITYAISGTATAGTDYTSLSGSASIAAGSSSVVIPILTAGHNDTTVEGNETIVITLTNTNHGQASVGVPDQATITIADDDSFNWSIVKTRNGSETNEQSAQFTVSLSQTNASGHPVTVELSDTGTGTGTSADDYLAFGETITIAPNQQSVIVDVAITDDALLEGSETIGAQITNPSDGDIAIGVATTTIEDDETGLLSVIASQATAAEHPADPGEFTISLNSTNDSPVPILVYYTVNGTATAGEDYAPLSGTAMITKGASETTISLLTDGYDDELVEGEESVIISLTGVSLDVVTIGAPASATVTISDNDVAPPIVPEEENPTNEPLAPAPILIQHQTPNRVTYKPESNIDQNLGQNGSQPDLPTPLPVDQVPADLDKDGIHDEEELKAFNNGDGNGDGIPDYLQKNVSSLVSKATKKPITLAAEGECQTITKFAILRQQELTTHDNRFNYANGLADYTLQCDKAKQSARVTLYLDHVVSDKTVARKYQNERTFTAIAASTIVNKPVGKHIVTTASFSISDGGVYDDDGKADGKISDPFGIATTSRYYVDYLWLLVVPVIIYGALKYKTRKNRKEQSNHSSI